MNFRGTTTLGARAAGPLPRGTAPGGADAGQRPALPATNAAPRALASAGRRLPGSLLPWNGNLGSAGRWPAFPGEPRLAARMRAGGPRSRRPTPRLVPSRPRPGDRRVHYRRGTTTLGAPAASPFPRGTAPGGADAGQRPALPARTNAVPLFPRVRGPATAGFTTAVEWQPWERGPLARFPGEPRLAARMRASGPRSRRGLRSSYGVRASPRRPPSPATPNPAC